MIPPDFCLPMAVPGFYLRGVRDLARYQESMIASHRALQPLPYAPSPFHPEQRLLAIQAEGFCDAAGGLSLIEKDPAAGVYELGYWIAAPFSRRGLTSEAVRVLALWLFTERRVRRLQLRCHSLNEPSQRLARRLGFQREATWTFEAGEVEMWARYDSEGLQETFPSHADDSGSEWKS